jgi:hypothetical protein
VIVYVIRLQLVQFNSYHVLHVIVSLWLDSITSVPFSCSVNVAVNWVVHHVIVNVCDVFVSGELYVSVKFVNVNVLSLYVASVISSFVFGLQVFDE